MTAKRFTPALRIGAISALLLSTLGTLANAQAFPNKPIRLIIPTAPGGGTDAVGRVLADVLTIALKQQVVPENKPGASGIIGSEALMRSPNDGYTLMLAQNAHTTNPALYKKLPYDTLKDFTMIAPVAQSPLVLIASTATGAKTVKDIAELGKRQPASMTFAAAEASTRLAAEMFGGAIGVPLTVVSYKATGAAVVDVMGGHINYSVTTIASTLAQRSGGKIQFVAALASERSPFLPDVPTMAEQGISDLEATAWYGVIGPANMPAPLVQQINAAVRTALENAEVRQRLNTLAVAPWSAGADDLDRFVRKEVALAIKTARKAGIEPE